MMEMNTIISFLFVSMSLIELHHITETDMNKKNNDISIKNIFNEDQECHHN